MQKMMTVIRFDHQQKIFVPDPDILICEHDTHGKIYDDDKQVEKIENMTGHVCTGPNVNNIRNTFPALFILSFMAMPSPKTNIFLYFIIYPAERTCKKGLSRCDL